MAHVFSSEEFTGLKRVTHKGLLAIVLVMGPFAIGVALLAEQILELMYGGMYAGNGLIVALMSVHILIHVLTVPFSSALAAIGRTDTPLYASTGAMVVTILAGYTLTKVRGLTGAMTAFISSGIVVLTVLYFFYRSIIAKKRGKYA